MEKYTVKQKPKEDLIYNVFCDSSLPFTVICVLNYYKIIIEVIAGIRLLVHCKCAVPLLWL